MPPRFVAIKVGVEGVPEGVAEVKGLSNAFDQVDSSARKTSGGLGAAKQSAAATATETKGLSNAFSQLDQVANQTAGSGLRNAFAESGLLRGEIRALASQIPIVGQVFRYSGNDIITWARNLEGAGGAAQKFQQGALKNIYNTFQGALSQAFRGKNDDVALLFQHIGIDVEKGITQPLPALKTFISEFAKIPDAEDRAAFAANVFGAQTAKLLPTLEGLAASEGAVTTASTGMGGGMLAMLGPIALVVAAVIALTAGIAIGGKALLDLTKLAETTGAEVYDLSQKVNFSAETISAIKFGGIKAGIEDIRTLSASLGIFDKNIALANESDTKLAKQFKDFHVDISNNEAALRSLFQALAALPPGEKQTELAMLAFGKSGKEMLGVLKAMDGDIDGTITKLEQMGLIISTKDAKAAAEFRDKLAVLELQITMIGVKIGQQLMPYLERLVDRFSSLATQVTPHVAEWANATIEHFKNVGTAIRALGEASVTVQSGGLIENDDGAWLLGKIIHWGTGAGLVYEALDRIGKKIREVKGETSGPLSPAELNKPGPTAYQDAINAKKAYEDEAAARKAALAGDFSKLPFTQQEEINKLLDSSKQRGEALRLEYQNLGETTKYAATQQADLKDRIKDLPPALDYLRSAIQKKLDAQHGENEELARNIDQRKAELKTADEAKKVNDQLAGSIEALKLRHIELNDAESSSRTELEKFNEAVASGKFKGATAENLKLMREWTATIDQDVANINKKKELDKAAEAQFKFANSVQAIGDALSQSETSALSNFDQGLTETHSNLKRVTDEIQRLSDLKLDRSKLDDFVKKLQVDPTQLAGAQNAFRELLSPEVRAKVSNDQTDPIISYLVRAIDLDHKLFEAQTPLSQLTREYNGLIREQADLSNPLIQSKTIENQLLRDKIDLQSRDLNATIATNRAQLELSDATIYHATQANAKVAEFLARQKSITDIVADAKTEVIQTTYDFINAGLDKMNSKLGRVGTLLTQIEGDFIKLALNKFFLWLLGGQSAGFGSGSSGSGGGILGGIFGGGGVINGTPPFAGAASVGGGTAGGQSLSQQLSSWIRGGGGGATNYASAAPFLASLTNEGIAVPTSLSSQTDLSSIMLHEGGHSAAPSLATGGLGAQLGAMLPFLGGSIGASLGGSLGGQSRFGSILGQIGGGAIGVMGGLVAGSSLFGTTALSTVAATLGISTGLLAGVTFGIGGALLVGALLLARNAARRKNETDRATLNNDTYSQVIQVLNDARAGKYDSAGSALSAFDQIKSNYFQRISGYDSKTKRIATEVWNDTKNGFEYYRPLIRDAAQKAIDSHELAKNMIPEFAFGGTVPRGTSYFSMATGLTPIKVRPGEVMIPPGGFGMQVPGVDRGYDSVYTMARPGTRVLTKAQAGSARGFATGGTVQGGQDGPTPIFVDLTIEVQNLIGKDDAGEIVVTGIKTNNGGNAVVQRVRIARADKEL